jgi:hypothetical protein
MIYSPLNQVAPLLRVLARQLRYSALADLGDQAVLHMRHHARQGLQGEYGRRKTGNIAGQEALPATAKTLSLRPTRLKALKAGWKAVSS